MAGREGSENLVIAEKRGECGSVVYTGVSRRLEFRGFKPDIHARGRGRLFMVSAAHVARRPQLTNAQQRSLHLKCYPTVFLADS